MINRVTPRTRRRNYIIAVGMTMAIGVLLAFLDRATEGGDGPPQYGRRPSSQSDVGRTALRLPGNTNGSIGERAQRTSARTLLASDRESRTSEVDSEHVRVGPTNSVQVFVYDELTRELLNCVDVLSAVPGPSFGRGSHPGHFVDHEDLVDCAQAPITLDFDKLRKVQKKRKVFVGGQGYTWKALEWVPSLPDGEESTSYSLLLTRAADLDVSVSGLEPETRGWLSIYSGSESNDDFLLLEIPISAAAPNAQIRGLPPGNVWIEFRKGWLWPTVLARKALHLIANSDTRIELEVDGWVEADPVPFKGTLVVHPEWDTPKEIHVTLSLIDEVGVDDFLAEFSPVIMNRLSPGVFSWSAGIRVPGNYALHVKFPPYSCLIELPPDGLTEFSVSIPAPLELQIQFRDAVSGRSIESIDAFWSHISGPSRRMKSLKRNESDSKLKAVVPEGLIELIFVSEAFKVPRVTTDLRRESKSLIIDVWPASGIDVVFLNDVGGAVELPAFMSPSCTVTGREGTWGFGFPRVAVSAPGFYELRISKIDGYEEIPTQEVQVHSGDFARHEVVLSRE